MSFDWSGFTFSLCERVKSSIDLKGFKIRQNVRLTNLFPVCKDLYYSGAWDGALVVQWLCGQWLEVMQRSKKQKQITVVLLKTQPCLGVSVPRDESTRGILRGERRSFRHAEGGASPGVVSVAIAVELVSGFEVERTLLKLLKKGLLGFHHGELRQKCESRRSVNAT